MQGNLNQPLSLLCDTNLRPSSAFEDFASGFVRVAILSFEFYSNIPLGTDQGCTFILSFQQVVALCVSPFQQAYHERVKLRSSSWEHSFEEG